MIVQSHHEKQEEIHDGKESEECPICMEENTFRTRHVKCPRCVYSICLSCYYSLHQNKCPYCRYRYPCRYSYTANRMTPMHITLRQRLRTTLQRMPFYEEPYIVILLIVVGYLFGVFLNIVTHYQERRRMNTEYDE